MIDDCTPTERRLERAMREHFTAVETLRKAKAAEQAARERVEELMNLLEREHAARKERKAAKVTA